MVVASYSREKKTSLLYTLCITQATTAVPFHKAVLYDDVQFLHAIDKYISLCKIATVDVLP
jgi:hypothetical protein